MIGALVMAPIKMIAGPESGDHYQARRIAAGVLAGSVVLGALGTVEALASVDRTENVHPSQKTELTVATTIPEQTCGVRLEAKFEKATAAVHYKIKSNTGIGPLDGLVNSTIGQVNLASWSESYTGNIGGLVCTSTAILANPVWDPTAPRRDCEKPADKKDARSVVVVAAGKSVTKECATGAFVMNIDEATDMTVIPYEVTPGTGWTSDNGGVAALLNSVGDLINGIPGLRDPIQDDQQNGLRRAVLADVIDEFSTTCAPAGIAKLSQVGNVSADANLAQPKSIQGNTIHNLVLAGNATLENYYIKNYGKQVYLDKMAGNPKYMMTADDYNVTFTPPAKGQAILNQYDRYEKPFSQIKAASKGKISFAPRNKYLACKDVTAKKGAKANVG